MKFVYILGALLVLVIIVAIAIANNGNSPEEYGALASCLTEKGFKLYGAYWCPHCIQQKEIFGSGEGDLPYIECSLPDNAGQTVECAQAGIMSYPTWELPSGKRIGGVLSIQELATLSNCPLNKTI